MGPYETYVNRSDIKKYHCHDPVMITPNIKNKPVIAYGIDRVEHGFNLMIVCPISLGNQPVPIIKRILASACCSKKSRKVP